MSVPERMKKLKDEMKGYDYVIVAFLCIGAAAAFVLLPPLKAVVLSVVFGVYCYISHTDFLCRKIYNKSILMLLALGIVMCLLGYIGVKESVISLAGATVAYILIIILAKVLTGVSEPSGMGDMKLFMANFFIGGLNAACPLFVGSLAALIYISVEKKKAAKNGEDPKKLMIPMGPFLALPMIPYLIIRLM